MVKRHQGIIHATSLGTEYDTVALAMEGRIKARQAVKTHQLSLCQSLGVSIPSDTGTHQDTPPTPDKHGVVTPPTTPSLDPWHGPSPSTGGDTGTHSSGNVKADVTTEAFLHRLDYQDTEGGICWTWSCLRMKHFELHQSPMTRPSLHPVWAVQQWMQHTAIVCKTQMHMDLSPRSSNFQ